MNRKSRGKKRRTYKGKRIANVNSTRGGIRL